MWPRPGLERDWGHRGREPGPGRGGPVLYWPLPATRRQGIIIAITQDLYQAVVSTSLFVMLSVSATMSLYQPMKVSQGLIWYKTLELVGVDHAIDH